MLVSVRKSYTRLTKPTLRTSTIEVQLHVTSLTEVYLKIDPGRRPMPLEHIFDTYYLNVYFTARFTVLSYCVVKVQASK